jgi:3-phenylpropionate/trans-cinnamate dioxygenase ferredoxin subunit
MEMSATSSRDWYLVGRLADFRVGELVPARIPGKDVWLLRRADDQFYAIKNSCPHRPAPICLGTVSGTFLPSAPGEHHFGLENEVIRCPRHAHEYVLSTGEPLIRGEKGRLVRYRVMVDDDLVLVSRRGM